MLLIKYIAQAERDQEALVMEVKPQQKVFVLQLYVLAKNKNNNNNNNNNK
jgi:hypothetical protein